MERRDFLSGDFGGCAVGVDLADGEDSCGEEIYDVVEGKVLYDAGECEIKVEPVKQIRLSLVAAIAIEDWKRRNMFVFGHGGKGKSVPFHKVVHDDAYAQVMSLAK